MDQTWRNVSLVVLMLLSLAQGAHAMDFGDALAFVMIVSFSFVGICACLGHYARRREAMQAI